MDGECFFVAALDAGTEAGGEAKTPAVAEAELDVVLGVFVVLFDNPLVIASFNPCIIPTLIPLYKSPLDHRHPILFQHTCFKHLFLFPQINLRSYLHIPFLQLLLHNLQSLYFYGQRSPNFYELGLSLFGKLFEFEARAIDDLLFGVSEVFHKEVFRDIL